MIMRGPMLLLVLAATPLAVLAQTLPAPTRDPLAIAAADDPLIKLVESQGTPEQFRSVVAGAAARHPFRGEAEANRLEARGGLAEARELALPRGEVTATSYRTIARAFSNDPDNIVERSRRRSRTDLLLSIEQPVIDFGAAGARIDAARGRVSASDAGIDIAISDVALRTIAAWYDIFELRALVGLSESFALSQDDLAEAVAERVEQGVSAEGDVARVESFIASADTRAAQFRRALANAEARYAELVGVPALAPLPRAPFLGGQRLTRDEVIAAVAETPDVRAATRQAEAARFDAKSVRAETKPQLSVGIDAGRYGVFETDRDYDIRGRVILRQRLFGGVEPRADQADARAQSLFARAERVRIEAERNAVTAWSDVAALEQERVAVQESYIAGRRSRDVLAERFRVARGSLFDLLAAEDAYFQTAAALLRTVAELDSARYVLLARTGRLLDALELVSAEPASSLLIESAPR